MADRLKKLSEAATQGEWTVCKKSNYDLIADGRRICTTLTYVGAMDPFGKLSAESLANAKLIVAIVNAFRAGELVLASEHDDTTERRDDESDLKFAVRATWGERCEEYELDCPICEAWREYYELIDAKLSEEGTLMIIQEERAEVLSLRRRLAEAQAQVAAAYEVAAKYHDEIFKHDIRGIEYSSLVGIPISNLGELEASCRRAEIDAKAIRALTPADATAALERIRQQARDEGAEAELDRVTDRIRGNWTWDDEDFIAEVIVDLRNTATLSADTQENSNE